MAPPRFASAASKASGLSRIERISCIAAGYDAAKAASQVLFEGLGSGPVKYALVMGSDRVELQGKTVEA
jgi:hypothetical protein